MASISEQLSLNRKSSNKYGVKFEGDEDFVEESVLKSSYTRAPKMTVADSVNAWKIHPVLAKNLEREGITEFFPVQRVVVPQMLRNNSRLCVFPRDICASAPTGSGKTVAYVLPILNTLLHDDVKVSRLRALLVLPSRELAAQVVGPARQMLIRIYILLISERSSVECLQIEWLIS